MSDQRISQLPSLPQSAVASGDFLPITDVSAAQTKKVTVQDLIGAGLASAPNDTIPIAALDQDSPTKIGANAISPGSINSTLLSDESSIAVRTTAPSTENYAGRGFFNNDTQNLQVFDGSQYLQVVMPESGIADGAITAAKIASGNIDTGHITPSGLLTAAYADESITGAKIASGTISGINIANGSVTAEKLAPGLLVGVDIGTSVVSFEAIQDVSTTDRLLGRFSAGSGNVEEIPCTAAGRALLDDADADTQRATLGLGTLATANGSWAEGSSFSGTSTGTNTGDQTITLTGDVTGAGTDSFATTIADNAITTSKINDGAVDAAKIADAAITAAKLADNSATIVATTTPVGSGVFIGQQHINTNTGFEYTWTGASWERLHGISTITFSGSSPITLTATYPDNFSADIGITTEAQASRSFWAGPTSGADASPTFRTIESTDLPVSASGVLGAASPGLGLVAVSGVFNHSNVVSSGTVNGITFDDQGHIQSIAALQESEIPALGASKIASGTFSTDLFADGSIGADKLADYATAQIGETLPVPDYIGQIFFNPLDKAFYLWDGNVWQPIGVSTGEIIFAGTYNASLNQVASVTTAGAGVGLNIASGLPAASASNENYYVVVAIAGSGATPAPSGLLSPPDLIISNGTNWVEIDVSSNYASQTAANIAFTPTGLIGSSNVQAAIAEVSSECRVASNITSGTLAVANGGTNLSSYTKGDILVASGATVLAKLPVGSQDQVLTVDSGATFGVKWGSPVTVSGGSGVTSVSSTTAALSVANSTTTPSLSIRSATTSVNGIVQLSDSISTTNSTLAATATAAKTAYDIGAAALPRAGGVITGAVTVGTAGSFFFEGDIDNGFETRLTAANPTADRTITLPNETGTVITTGSSGAVTSAMIADGTIVNADVSASAAIADSKLATISTANKVSASAIDINGATDIGAAIADADLLLIDDGGAGTNRKTAASRVKQYAYAGISGDVTITSLGVAAISAGAIVNADINGSAAIAYSKLALSGSIVNADIGSSAAIAHSKLASIPSARILLGNSSNVATATAVTGDVTISNTGVTAIAAGAIVNADISNSAAIAHSKLASVTAGRVLLGNSSNVATATAVTGDVTISNTGVTSITGGAIVNADVNSAAAIAGTKINPDFGGQLIVTDTRIDVGQRSSPTPGQGNTVTGHSIRSTGQIHCSTANADTASLNRNSNGVILSARRSGTQVGTISVTASNTSYNTTSDYRLKENVVPLADSVGRLLKLKPSRFNFITSPEATIDGFLAHEVGEVVPEAVLGEKDALDEDGNPVYQQMDAAKLVPLLVAALQKALEQIDELETRITRIERS